VTRACLSIAIVLVCACRNAAIAPPSTSTPATAPPTVELVETTPIETSLDHPDIPDAYTVWPAMLSRAKRTIDLAEFYVSNEPGSRLEPTLQALEAAKRDGVRVRLLVDHELTTIYADTLERLRRAGIEIRVIDLSKVTGGILHAKYFVVDEREAFFGSQNLDWRALQHIVELGARVTDPAVVARLSTLFARDWALAAGEAAPAVPTLPVSAPKLELVASPRDLLPAGINWDLPRIIDLIASARTHVRIQLLTFKSGDWLELSTPLETAAARGVRVELAVSNWSTRPAQLESLHRLASAGVAIRIVTIPQWSGGFIPYARVTHAKLLVVDGSRAWLGTSNWERDYFYGSRNVGLVIGEPGLAARILSFSESVWTSPYASPFDPAVSYPAPRLE
jgi:phosphatidylserine/phosphatidylglycerophosphate/cardiolipin synthase-like enzyme